MTVSWDKRSDKSKAQMAEYAKVYQKKNYRKLSRYIRGYRLMKQYGLTRKDVETMTAKQNGMCAICMVSGTLSIDHCHMTGRISGLLCQPCNMAIGLLQEDPEILRRASDYVLEYK